MKKSQSTTSKSAGRSGAAPSKVREVIKPASILLSKRANVVYLEHCKVLQKDNRVLFLSVGDKDSAFYNIPHQNTMFLLLGKGTSITDSAIRMLSEANVIVGFSGSDGSPLISAVDICFLSPQGEYRPTEYMQGWMKMWVDESRRLAVAKEFLKIRLASTQTLWVLNPELARRSIVVPDTLTAKFLTGIDRAMDTQHLLSAEGEWAKGLYGCMARGFNLSGFVRDEKLLSRATKGDTVNGFLTHGNYICYGFAAVVLYALGISYALPVLHGKTRRGALVFDVADLFKDSICMPMAFIHAEACSTEGVFRKSLITEIRIKTLDEAFETVKKLSM